MTNYATGLYHSRLHCMFPIVHPVARQFICGEQICISRVGFCPKTLGITERLHYTDFSAFTLLVRPIRTGLRVAEHFPVARLDAVYVPWKLTHTVSSQIARHSAAKNQTTLVLECSTIFARAVAASLTGEPSFCSR